MLALAEWETHPDGPADQVAQFLEERSETGDPPSPVQPVRRHSHGTPSARPFMNRIQLEHIIRAASQISDDPEIVVIGSQAIHAQNMKLPPVAFQSTKPTCILATIPSGPTRSTRPLGSFHPFITTHGYYAHGVSPATAILPAGWEQRLIPLHNANTGGATGLCLDVHDLAMSKYAAGREQDITFNRELARHGIVSKRQLTRLVPSMPIDDARKRLILDRIERDFVASNPRTSSKPSRS